MTILDRIVETKKQEIKERRSYQPISLLKQSAYFERNCYSTKSSLLNPNKTGIITEFKRQSPSKGVINSTSDIKTVTSDYQKHGASAISILTDTNYFGGNNEDILQMRPLIHIPILRKDFIIDDYQVYETKSIGADLMLLIAECLTKDEVYNLARLAKELGLEVLLEMHSEEQLDKINPYIDIVGVNNRDLKTFEVDLEKSIALFHKIPSQYIRITESGISSPQDFLKMKNAGFQGFLIGENFMKEVNPGYSFELFLDQIND